jgi:hypothetical protein
MPPMPPSTLRPQYGNVNRNVAQPPVPPQTLIMNAMMQAAMLDRQHQQQMQQQQVGPTLSMAPAPPMVRPGFVPMTGMAPAAPPSLNGPQPGAPPMSISQMQANAPAPPQPVQNDMQRMLDMNFAATGQPFGRTPTTQDERQQEKQAAFISDPSQVTGEFFNAQPKAIQDLITQWQQARGNLADAVNAGDKDAIAMQAKSDETWMGIINAEIQSSLDLPKEQRAAFGQAPDPEGVVGNVLDFMAPELRIIGALDIPRQVSVGRAGEDAYKVANGQEQSAIGKFLTWFPGQTDFQDWMRKPENAPFIKNAYENGYTASNGQEFTGGKAVWELFINNESRWKRGIYDLAYDPTTYAGVAAKPLEGAAAVAEGVEPAGRAGQAVAATLRGAATAANVPNVVLNEAADHLVSGALGKFGGLVRKAPVVGKLAETAPATIGEDAAKRRMEGIIFSDAARADAAGVAPTTNIGGIPEPQPETVTHALAAGDIPQPGTPPVNELSPSPHPIEVTPEGEALPTDPNYIAEGAEPPPPPVTVSKHTRGTTTVGDAGEYRIKERGIGDQKQFWVEEQVAGPKTKYTPIKSYPTLEEAVNDATARVRGTAVPEPGQTLSELGQPVSDAAPQPNGPKLLTPEDRAAGLREGTVKANAPYEGGTRLTDKAAQLGQQPEHAAAYQRFLEQDVPTPEQVANRQAVEGVAVRPDGFTC